MTRYKEAIRWIAENDDTCWLGEYEIIPSVTASLVADVFDKPMDTVIRDLIRAVEEDDSLNSGNG